MSDLEMRFQRDAALLKQARSIQMNPSYFLMFGICLLFVVLGVVVVGVSGLTGWIIVGATLAIGALGVVTGQSNLILAGMITVLGGLTGVASLGAMVLAMFGMAGH